MRHAFLGMGGIGGLLAAALARAGETCVVLLRPETLAGYPGRISVESAVLGDFEVEVPATSMLDRDVDVLWIATKATQLEHALALAPAERVGRRERDPADERHRSRRAAAQPISDRDRRRDPGRVGTPSARTDRAEVTFPAVELAGGEAIAANVRDAGIECRVRDDERSVLWDKLAFLAPIALATTALDAPLGAVRDDERYQGCRDEALAIATAEGAKVDQAALFALQQNAPSEMRSSMQKDVAAGREPELDAIAGPILRGGRRHTIPVPNTEALVRLITKRTTNRATSSAT